MTEKITITANIGVQNGPSISVNRVMEVQAYEMINVDIKTADPDKVVKLPGTGEGETLLLAITSSWYGDGKDTDNYVTYKVNDNGDEFKLDQPHLLIGNSSVTMLNSVPTKLLFSYTKGTTSPDLVKIEILIGLKVTL
jgi:hypothetical protein